MSFDFGKQYLSLYEAVRGGIQKIGLKSFKETSMFGWSGQKDGGKWNKSVDDCSGTYDHYLTTKEIEVLFDILADKHAEIKRLREAIEKALAISKPLADADLKQMDLMDYVAEYPMPRKYTPLMEITDTLKVALNGENSND